jgi:hypothetical protein
MDSAPCTKLFDWLHRLFSLVYLISQSALQSISQSVIILHFLREALEFLKKKKKKKKKKNNNNNNNKNNKNN